MLNVRNVATGLAVSFLVLSFAALPGGDAGPAQTGPGDLIYVPVTVTDNKNVPVATLKETDFQLLEDNKEQKIASFSAAGEPMTVGIVLGLSQRGPVTSPGQLDRVTKDILNAVTLISEAGTPAARADQIPLDSDSMFSVMQKNMDALAKQPNPRKTLVVVSDGLNSSQMQATNAPLPKGPIEASKSLPFPIHFLTVTLDRAGPSFQEGTNWSTGYYLQQMADFSGGDSVLGQIDNDLARVATTLRDKLKNQYVLGYKSPNAAKDGKWRKINVKIAPTAGKFKVSFKERYVVPKG
jgi:Ca-activated chloride channel family protein